MTDQIPADKVRDLHRLADKVLANTDSQHCTAIALANLVKESAPAPPLPTLADMTKEERRACQWMQADVENRSVRYVIAAPDDGDGETTLIGPDGGISWFSPERVTPRPDLPRMMWPGNKKAAPALPDGWRLANHPQYGRVVVTSTEPDDAGYVWFVRPDPYGGAEGYDAGCCKPDVLTYIDQGADQ